MASETDQKSKYLEVVSATSSGRTTSTVTKASFVTTRSFISTNFSCLSNDSEVPKSSRAIENLPNYNRKSSLNQSLEFTVVFQGIEIERLTAEIESCRIRIKDMERLTFTNSNYEVQIRELTEKCCAYESERLKFTEQNQKLNLVCHQLYTEAEDAKAKHRQMDVSLKSKYEAETARSSVLETEIERWKTRYESANKSKAKELEDMRLMMESQRKSVLDLEMRQLNAKFHAERGNYESEIRRLRDTLEQKSREVEETRQSHKRSQIRLMELKTFQLTVAQQQNRLATMAIQIQRLNEMCNGKQDDLNQALQRERKLQQQFKNQQEWEHQARSLKSLVERKNQEVEEWRVLSIKYEQKVSHQTELIITSQGLTSKLAISVKENQKLNQMLKRKLSELQASQARVALLETQLSHQTQQESTIQNYRRKIEAYECEQERLNQILRTRLVELDETRNKNVRLQVRINSYAEIEHRNTELSAQIHTLTRTCEENRLKALQYEAQIKSMHDCEDRCRSLQNEVTLLKTQIERLNNTVLRSKVKEIEDLKLKVARLEQSIIQYKSVEARLAEYEKKIATMVVQIEQLSNKLREKTNQLEEKSARITALEQQLDRLRSAQTELAKLRAIIVQRDAKISELQKTIESDAEKIKKLEAKIKQLEWLIFTANMNRDRILALLIQKTFEYEVVNAKYIKLQNEFSSLKRN